MDTRTTSRALGSRGLLLWSMLAVSLALIAVTSTPALTALAQDPATYPLTLVDDEGTEVTLDALPQRIISLSPANTEIVYSLGAGDRLVGGTDFDDFPPQATELTDVATFTGVILEQVVELDPDLVLAAGNFFTPPDDIERMRELGYPVIVIYAPDVPTVLADIELIGVAVGEPDEAEAIVVEMTERMDQVSAAVSATESRPRTFYQIGSEPEIFGPAPQSFLADMIELANGEPITTGDAAVFSIPLERLIVADPEVIVVGDANYGVCPDAVAARPGWDAMTAVANGDIRPIDDIPVTRPGPRLADGLAALALAIHPGLELAGFEPGPAPCTAG